MEEAWTFFFVLMASRGCEINQFQSAQVRSATFWMKTVKHRAAGGEFLASIAVPKMAPFERKIPAQSNLSSGFVLGKVWDHLQSLFTREWCGPIFGDDLCYASATFRLKLRDPFKYVDQVKTWARLVNYEIWFISPEITYGVIQSDPLIP